LKWKLNEAIAFQKNERVMQTRPVSNDENTDDKPQVVQSENLSEVPAAPALFSDKITTDTIAIRENSSRSQGPVVLKQHESVNDDLSADDKAGYSKTETKTSQQDRQEDNRSARSNGQPSISVENENIVASTTLIVDSSAAPSAEHKRSPDAADNFNFKYRVQIAASPSRLTDSQLKKIYKGPNKIREFKEDEYYKYYIGETPGYYQADQIMKESNIGSAFISVYKDDQKWPLNDAIALQYKVPDLPANLLESDSIVKIVTVNFGLDEFILPPDERLHLAKYVIDELKANEFYYAIVNGYTDIRGSEAYNFGLSQERAFFVEQSIVTGGVGAGRVATRYFGESQVVKFCPANERCDESIHQANRRVEILLLTRKTQLKSR
jgi:outer membrane protein OmpA-like peptidoglycan-associated protein